MSSSDESDDDLAPPVLRVVGDQDVAVSCLFRGAECFGLGVLVLFGASAAAAVLGLMQ